MALAVIYGIAGYDKVLGAKPLTQGVSIAYESLFRFTWSLAVLWVVFSCYKGYGGKKNG